MISRTVVWIELNRFKFRFNFEKSDSIQFNLNRIQIRFKSDSTVGNPIQLNSIHLPPQGEGDSIQFKMNRNLNRFMNWIVFFSIHESIQSRFNIPARDPRGFYFGPSSPYPSEGFYFFAPYILAKLNQSHCIIFARVI